MIAEASALDEMVTGSGTLGAVVAGESALGEMVAGAATLVAGVLWAIISGAVSLLTAAVVCAGTLVAMPWLGIGVVATASTSPVGYTRVASVAVTTKVTWGIVIIVVTKDVVRVTTTPDETPVVMVVGSQGTTVVMVRTMV